MPLPLRISLPALYQAHDQVKMYPPVAGELTALSVEAGAMVQAGDPIFALSSLPLHYQLRETSLRIDLLKKRLGRQVADQEERANIQININSLLAEENQLRSIHLQNADLKREAPISGTVTFLDEQVRVGDVVNRSNVLVEIASFEKMEVRAFVSETDRHRLQIGAAARFVPEDLFRSSINASIVETSEAGEREVALPYFQSTYGGGIAVEESEDNLGQMKPIEAVYQVRFLVEEGGLLITDNALRGTIHVVATAESFGIRAFRQIAKVFLRELGL
ncbi:MAG: HlyD family efflux transporter periplasmic adaptor subunit [Hyphomicrobiales bacterium]